MTPGCPDYSCVLQAGSLTEPSLPGAWQRPAAAHSPLKSSPAPPLPIWVPQGERVSALRLSLGTGSRSSSWSWGDFSHYLAMPSPYCGKSPNRTAILSRIVAASLCNSQTPPLPFRGSWN